MAAADLQKYLQRITGADFAVRGESEAGGGPLIVFGAANSLRQPASIPPGSSLRAISFALRPGACSSWARTETIPT